MTSRPPQTRKTYEERKAQAEQFLRDHTLGIFATGRRDGSPQQSVLRYSYTAAGDVVIATGDSAAKVKNARRNPGVSLAVYDGPTCVVVWGRARLLQGADAEAYLGEPPGNGSEPGEPTLIVLTPETFRWARLDG